MVLLNFQKQYRLMPKISQSIKEELKTIRNLIHRRINVSPKTETEIIDSFHRLYYNSYHFGKAWGDMKWLGTRVTKCPLDCWIYQEILFEQKPDVIIECGTSHGGSALFLASICDLLNKGRVITVDIRKQPGLPEHDRIKYLSGSSTDPQVVAKVKEHINPGEKILVILDSLHTCEHVLREMNIYGPLVSKGSYMIVEDSNLNGHPVKAEEVPGPMEAIYEFFKNNKEFEIDKSREKLLLTWNPNGYLKKVR